MPRPSNPRKPEKLVRLVQPKVDDPRLVGQLPLMFTAPKGIDRYSVSARTDTDSAFKIRNLVFDSGNLVSRLGTDMMGGNAASTVMQVLDFVRKGQKKVTIRFCLRHLEIFEYGSGTWRSFPVPLTGSERDFFAYTGWANKLLFSNGVDGLWEFDFTSMVAKIIPGAPSAKHLTTFGNRVVATSTVESGQDYPLRVRWSVKNNYLDWIGQGSGYEDNYGSPTGVVDEAMAVVPYSDEQAWLVRSQSVSQMSVSGNVLAPFRFSQVLAWVGTPYRNSIVKAPLGVIFASRDDVHLITNSGHQQIGTKVMDDITDEVESLNGCYGAFDYGRQEYRLAIGAFVWRYRLLEHGWTADEYPFEIRALGRQIQGVAGIPIDNLPATIDELSGLFPPGAINDLVYDRSFDDAMMFVPDSTDVTLRETDEPRDVIPGGEETDSEMVLDTGVLNLDALKASEFHGLHMEYESEMDQELLFDWTQNDGTFFNPLSVKDIEATEGSEMLFVKQELVSRKLRLRLRSTTLGKLRLLGIAPILVQVERSMAPKKPKPATIQVLPSPLSLVVGGTQPLSFRVLDANGAPITGMTGLTMVSTNNSVATISGTGLVRGVGAGSAGIVISVRNVQVVVQITVTAATPAAVASITVTPGISQGAAGSSQQFTATLRDANGNILTGRTVVWSSATPSFATVNSAGLATLVSAGVTAISATSEGVTGASTLTVTASPAVVVTVDVTPATFTLEAGDTIQLVASPKDGSSNVLSGKVISWASDAPSIATVNATGLVTAIAAGSVTITATCETIDGDSTGTITAAIVPVSTVSVSPTSFTKAVGLTQALVATTRDVNGNVLVGRLVTWMSSNVAVATVDSSGLVTAVAEGTAIITATSEGKNGTSSATITAVPVASVTVSPTPFAINAGVTQQLVATPKDSLNNPLTGRVITWGTSDPTIATVSSTGLVVGIAAGSVIITASCETKTGIASGTIGAGVYSALNAPPSLAQYVPEPNPAGVVAQLPTVFLNSNPPTSFVSTVTLTEQGSRAANTVAFQAAIDAAAARSGNSRINLPNNFQVRRPQMRKHAFVGSKTLVSWANLAVADDVRVTVSDMTNAPSFWAQIGGEIALSFDRAADEYYFEGIKFKAESAASIIYDLIYVGPREGAVDFNDNITNIPDKIVFNRCLIEGNDSGSGVTGNVRNGFNIQAKNVSIVNCHIHQIGFAGFESHGIVMYNSPGPLKIENNFIEATSINVFIGGAIPSYGAVAGRPKNVTIRRNDIYKRLQWAKDDGLWDGVSGRGIKNPVETKNVDGSLIEGNRIHSCWADGQVGYAIVIKSGTGDGISAAGCGSENVVVRHNQIFDSVRGPAINGLSDETDAIPTKKVAFYNNAIYAIGSYAGQTAAPIPLILTQSVDDLYFKHNTLVTNIAPGTLQLALPTVAKAQRFVFSDNIVEYAYLWSEGILGDNGLKNWAAVGYVWERNVSIIANPGDWGIHTQGTNQFDDSRNDIGFTNLAAGDLTLTGASPYKGDGEGGSDPGVDMTKVTLATSGV